MNTTLTSAISKLTFGTLFLFAVVAVHAQSPAPAAGVGKEDSTLVKYLGTQDDMVIFNVSYKNPGGAPFNVIIKDQDWTQLYQGTFKDKDFYKQFRLPKAEKDKITFIIRSSKDADIAKTFSININSRIIEDVAVRKLN
jgi:hypothetical protein